LVKNCSSSSQDCTKSLKAVVRPEHLLRGPLPCKKKDYAVLYLNFARWFTWVLKMVCFQRKTEIGRFRTGYWTELLASERETEK
jgi:hypothetical protein